jgi:predicted membrane-bound spermidine synthase
MTRGAHGRLRHTASLALMALSGCAGLGYQIVWTQQSALWLGHEAAAVLAVVTAFFGGIALGALALGAHIERSAHPRRWYAACEAVIGLWGLLLIFLMAPFSGWVLDLIGVQPTPLWQWTVAFSATLVLLLPATAAMGATLPAMERVMAQAGIEGRSIAAHYAANTAGAVAGVLVTAFWWVPAFGLAHTAGLCVALNLLCAAAALVVLPHSSAPALQTIARPAVGACRAGAPGLHRPAGHRLRGAGGAGAEPGHRRHGLHLRDAAGGLPRRQRARGGGVSAMGNTVARPRPLGRSTAVGVGRGLPARQRQPLGR